MFLTGPAITAVLPPFVILAAYSAAAHAAAHYHGHPLWASQGARLHAALLRNRQRAMHLAAQLEVTLGFWMVLMLLVPSRRSFILTFFVVSSDTRASGRASPAAGPQLIACARARAAAGIADALICILKNATRHPPSRAPPAVAAAAAALLVARRRRLPPRRVAGHRPGRRAAARRAAGA